MTLFVRDNFLGDSELAGLVKESSDFFPPVMPGENIGGTKHVMVVNVWHKDNIPYALGTGDFHFENH